MGTRKSLRTQISSTSGDIKMPYKTILLNPHETHKNIAHLRLNRPDCANAFNGEMITELRDAIAKLKEQSGINLIILSGHGKHFCAGADLNWMQHIAQCSDSDNLADAKQLATLLYELYQLPQIVIGVTQGATSGGGMGLLACCDLVFAAETATFCFPEVKLGLIPATIMPYVIAKLGVHAAKSHMILADRFDTNEAKIMNWIQGSFSDHQLNEHVEQALNQLITYSAQALITLKQAFHRYTDITPDLIEQTAEELATLRRGQNAQARIHAFLKGSP